MAFTNPPLIRTRPMMPRDIAQLGIKGIYDSADPAVSSPQLARQLINVYPLAGEGPQRCVGWPGFDFNSGTQLGQLTSRTPQCRYQFTRTDRSEFTLDFVGGKVYEYDWVTDTHTEIVLGGGAVLDTVAPVFCETFHDAVVVTDGVNRPFLMEEAAGVWTCTVLSNAPIAYGPPVVHADQLFFINAADPLEIQWSEVADATIGYAPAPYNYAWRLGMTAQDRFYAMCASEGELYLARANSITKILGEVTPEYESTSTSEAVAEGIGTITPVMLRAGGYIWFLDSNGRPQRFPVGGTLDLNRPMWHAARETVKNLPRVSFEKARIVYWPELEMVLYAVAGLGSTEPSMILGFNIATGSFQTIRRGSWKCAALALLKDADVRPVIGHLDAEGYAYSHGHTDGNRFDDVVGGVDVPITHTVEGCALGYTLGRIMMADQIDIVLHVESDVTDLAFDYQSPNGWSGISTLEDLTGGSSTYGSAVFGTSLYGGSSLEQRITVGLGAEVRWLRPRVRHAALSEKFGFDGWELRAFTAGKAPEIK